MPKYGKYDDIIHCERPKSSRPPMPMHKRAAQFSPFAALSGYEEAIEETQRVTEEEISLGDEQIEDINRKIAYIQHLLPNCPTISITYFEPDIRKTGGAYITKECDIKKIDEYTKRIVMKDKSYIEIEEIVEINGDIFSEMY